MACVGIKDSDRNIPEEIKKIDENERILQLAIQMISFSKEFSKNN